MHLSPAAIPEKRVPYRRWGDHDLRRGALREERKHREGHQVLHPGRPAGGNRGKAVSGKPVNTMSNLLREYSPRTFVTQRREEIQ